MPESFHDTTEQIFLDEDIVFCAQQLTEIIMASSGGEDIGETFAEIFDAYEQDYQVDFIIEVAAQLAKDRRGQVRRQAVELLRPYSGHLIEADSLLWDGLLQDRTQGVLVATYEMLREHGQNTTFEDLSNQRPQRTFPGIHTVERVVKMSAAAPAYEKATRKRK